MFENEIVRTGCRGGYFYLGYLTTVSKSRHYSVGGEEMK
jgi:hypothetical protein